MPPAIPVITPAGFAPTSAIGFAEPDTTLATVSLTKPLPITAMRDPASSALTGAATISVIVGPFAPTTDRPVILALSGVWSGTVKVQRSTDGGTTKLGLTAAGTAWGVFTANCCEPVWEEASVGAALYLDITVTSGTIAYRMGQ